MTNESNGLSGNGELEQVAGGNDQSPVKQIPIEAVDALADELVQEYANPTYRRWYCGIIYQFGLVQVAEWRQKAASGRNPGGLFGYYVMQARAGAGISPIHKPALPRPSGFVPDTVHPVRENETDEELSKNIDQTLRETEQPVDMSAWDKAAGSSAGTDDDG